jgi:hypothetical protein
VRAAAGGLAFLLAPLFCLLVRAALRPPEVVIGTLSLWLRGPAPAASAARARGALPPWAWCCAGGLVLGALAWAGPRRSAPVAPGRWTCVVDRSPSMALPLADGRSRLEAALAAAEGWLAAHAARADRVSWTATARARLELARDERPPPEWLAPAREVQREPEWSGFDQPGTLWLTDRAPEVAREHAGLFASGGPAGGGRDPRRRARDAALERGRVGARAHGAAALDRAPRAAGRAPPGRARARARRVGRGARTRARARTRTRRAVRRRARVPRSTTANRWSSRATAGARAAWPRRWIPRWPPAATTG